VSSDHHRPPEAYPRRVLLAVTGLTPQVVTETLFALSQRQHPPFVPTEIHLLTTAAGAEHARLNLLSAEPGWFHRLRADYGLPDIAFDADEIHILRDHRGYPMPDIRTPEENEQAADFITGVVARLTADRECALHVSLAGGRKTMGYYLGYALSLFGRPQDRLSHVLVSAPFESHPQFYYPTPQERVIHSLDRQQLALDCRRAEVTLAVIPFVRLREGLPRRLLDGRAGLSEVVAAANRALEPPQLILDLPPRRASADEQPFDLTPTEFAVLWWLARRARDGQAEVDWSTAAAAREFLACAAELLNPMSGDYERMEQAIEWRFDAPIKLARYFEPHKSRINASLDEVLGSTAVRRYAIARTRENGAARFYLPLRPEEIEIRPETSP
jgi:CRISPR-associated protein (TIGR02584 family)